MENSSNGAVSNFINNKVLPPIMKFVNTKPVKALQDGMVYALPLLSLGPYSWSYLIFQFQLWLLLLRPLVGQRSLTRPIQ